MIHLYPATHAESKLHKLISAVDELVKANITPGHEAGHKRDRWVISDGY